MMHIDDFSLYFQRVPYLSIEKASAQRVEFLFRGAAGRAQRCALGAVLALAFPCNSGAAVRRTIRRPRRFSKRIASLYYWHPALLRWIWVCRMRAVSGCSGSALIRKRCRRRTRFLPRSTIWSTSCVFYITDVLKCRAVAVTAICVIRLKQRNLPRNAGKKCGEKHWNIRRRRVVLRSDAR